MTKETIDWGKGGRKEGSKAGPKSYPKASIERDESTGDLVLAILAPDLNNRTFLFRSYGNTRADKLVRRHRLIINTNNLLIDSARS